MDKNSRELHHTADACKIGLSFDPPMASEDLRSHVCFFLRELTEALEEEGCKLIGHIKLLAEAEDGSALFCSVTSFGREPKCKGDLRGSLCRCSLTLNVILYGISKEALRRIVTECRSKYFGV